MKLNKLFAVVAATGLLISGCGQTVADAIGDSDKKEKVSKTTETTETASEDNTESSTQSSSENEDEQEGKYDFTVCFAGDISLADDAVTTAQLDNCDNGIRGCISQTYISNMQNADITCVNNEFAYSENGSPMDGKAYTFRANPSRVSVLQDLGVDVVSLANNHVYDYGEQAFIDTLDTLDGAQISYFGAGRNINDAMAPVYKEVDGKKIAFVGATRAEKNIMTPEATEDSPGVLRCYDTALLKQTIQEAKVNADFVIVYVHWGTEYSTELEEAQTQTAREYIDSGADVIIGAHSHCLQGMEYYNGKPIIYSMGNFWFNNKTLDTMQVNLEFSGDNETSDLKVKILPGQQKEAKTYYFADSKDQQRVYDYLESISIGVIIDDEGYIHQQQ